MTHLVPVVGDRRESQRGQKPTFSLLSAVRNEEAFIGAMIQSVLAQTCADWELIVVDDGSSDQTFRIVAEQAAKDQRIRLVASEGSGKVQAFNSAYTHSQGEYVALLAGDDTLPEASVERRIGALIGLEPDQDAVGFFKLRTMSTERRYDGLVLPKGESASRSGGSLTLTRRLADRVFPIPDDLVAEDLWLANAATGLADEVVESTEIVLNYRIHSGNSNPRRASFAVMSAAMAARHRAWRLLLQCDRFELAPPVRRRLVELHRAETLRVQGAAIRLLLRSGLPFADRAAMAAMSRPSLFWVRTRLNRILSGRRGA